MFLAEGPACADPEVSDNSPLPGHYRWLRGRARACDGVTEEAAQRARPAPREVAAENARPRDASSLLLLFKAFLLLSALLHTAVQEASFPWAGAAPTPGERNPGPPRSDASHLPAGLELGRWQLDSEGGKKNGSGLEVETKSRVGSIQAQSLRDDSRTIS